MKGVDRDWWCVRREGANGRASRRASGKVNGRAGEQKRRAGERTGEQADTEGGRRPAGVRIVIPF